VGLPREEGSGFYQDGPFFLEDAVLTAEAGKLRALFGRQTVGTAASVKI
jgi:hypothetical protein